MRFPIIGIGASAGGLKALEGLFRNIPNNTGMAYVVIVHLSRDHESQMEVLLQRHTQMPVVQVRNTQQIEPDHVYVIPPNKYLSIADSTLSLFDQSSAGPIRAPIDLFFRRLADAQKENSIAIILSGTGSDGAIGLARIKEVSGVAMAQDPEEAEYDGMPRSAITAGVVDIVLPVSELAEQLVRIGQKKQEEAQTPAFHQMPEPELEAFSRIQTLLRTHTGQDFTQYKPSTVLRRIKRRTQLTGLDSLTEYLSFLRDNPRELQTLQKDLLISVTNFFRDPQSFEILDNEIIPNLAAAKKSGEDIRIWVAGCATGEEAYSIAMIFAEHQARLEAPIGVQVFATDLSDDAIRSARDGCYPESIVADVSPERLARFFTREPGGYRVRKELRDMVLFSRHNLLKDPPFSKLDLVSCRNLLIYMKREVQGRILEVFHYALLPGGFLFLGTSESASDSDLFLTQSKEHRIFQRSRLSQRAPVLPPVIMPRSGSIRVPDSKDRDENRAPAFNALYQKLIARFAPPSLIVNDKHEVVHVFAGAEVYLRIPHGSPTQDVLKLIREELRLDLRTALFQALEKQKEYRSRPIPVHVEGEQRLVDLIAQPIEEPAMKPRFAHVIVREVNPAETTREKREVTQITDGPAATPTPPENAEQVRQLEEQLDRLREQLQNTIEEHESAIEELKSSNEELQSANEELKSTAEELETSREELQSMNEELQTLNQEHRVKIDEISQVNSDLQNLMAATDIGTIFLDRQLRIKRFTPHVEQFINIIGSDIGRPLSHLTHKLGYNDLVTDAERILRDLVPIEQEIASNDGRFFLVRLRPYRTIEDRIGGVVITFIDITERKKYEDALQASKLELQQLNESLEARVQERTDQVRALASALTLAEQQERRRVSQILHDDLQQQLYGIQMKARLHQKDLQKKPPDQLQDQVEALYKLLESAINTTRRLTVDLSPPVLQNEGLVESVQWLIAQMEEAYGMKVSLQVLGTCRIPNKDIRVLLFQLVRELLFNVVKHASVQAARVSISHLDGQCVIEVSDEGVGFNAAQAGSIPEPEGGFGLYSVRERLQLFGGRLDIESSPGKGTRMRIVAPLDQTGIAEQSVEVGGESEDQDLRR